MSSNDPLLGKQLGDYKILGLLGQGGMARVYRGYDENLARYAAVKVFDTYLVADDELAEYQARFQREARAIARLRHPQIVGVYQFGQSDNLHYMAMVFIEGRDLRYILKEHAAHNTRMSFIDILRIITDVASALDYAHREGVIHRDVKPSNIMVMADGHAILTDFGLALNVPEGTIGTTFGSVHYIAPEQAVSSARAVPQSDLYSLGVVLYEMLTGRVPFEDASAMSVALKHLSDTPPLPSQLNPEIAPAVEAMVMRSLDKEPKERYQNGSDMVRALEIAFGMTDEDELTRKLMALPDWALHPELSLFKSAASRIEKISVGESPTSTPGPSTGKPSTPAAAEDSSKLISQRSAPSGLAQPKAAVTAEQLAAARRRMMIRGGVAVFAGVLVVFLLLSLSSSTGTNPRPTTPVTLAVAAAVTSTTIETTAEPTETKRPTQRPATAEPAASEEPPSLTSLPASATLAPRTTIRPSATVRATVVTETMATPAPSTPVTRQPATTAPTASASPGAPDQGQIELIYNSRSLVLHNRSDETINVADLSFVQVTAEGRELVFRASSWEGTVASSDTLAPGACLMVWVNEIASLPQPDYCQSRPAFFLAGPARWFWISPASGAVFEVRRSRSVLAECEIRAGRCVVQINETESDQGTLVGATSVTVGSG